MPQFPWQKSSNRNSSRPGHASFFFSADNQHPDLPLPRPRTQQAVHRSTSVTERHVPPYLDNRRSVAFYQTQNPSQALPPEETLDYYSSHPPPLPILHDADTRAPPGDYQYPSQSPGRLNRSQTVLHQNTYSRSSEASPNFDAPASPSPPSQLWSPDFQLLPSPSEQLESITLEGATLMNNNITPGKTSSDSGSASGLDRWSQRRLQRLNTEQGFREQRQGSGGAALSPAPNDHVFAQSHAGNPYAPHEAQPQSLHHPSQPQPSYPTSRSGSNASTALQSNTLNTTHSRSQNYTHDASQQHHHSYSPPDTSSSSQYQPQANGRPNLQPNRSFTQQPNAAAEADSMAVNSINHGSNITSSAPNNINSIAAPKAVRSAATNRQSIHNDLLSRDTTSQTPQPAQADPRRPTPQPLATSEDMSEEEVNQLIKDHKELREKYTKVKKYYFEKEDQVKQLQNSLAHQRLSQSRTSLDDSEYTTRFNRLDGLIAQLAFSIRKSWRSLPTWLANSVNKDAVVTGKQEMTAAGRAFISCWLVEEVFDKYFHPDLDPTLSSQLKNVQTNIRRYAPHAQTSEEEDYLTSKIVNWRLATLEGLQDALRSPQCPTYRAQLTDMLKEHLCGALSVHLQDPPPSDLEGGVHMIVELVVSIAIHLPLESRDVNIGYFMPSHGIVLDQMKIESGIPPLTTSIAEDAAERASMKSANSDVDNLNDNANVAHDAGQGKKRSMLSALTGSSSKITKGTSIQNKQSGAGGSSSSLQRPESSAGGKDDAPPKVRMAAGIGVSIRGRSVLVKAPVFST